MTTLKQTLFSLYIGQKVQYPNFDHRLVSNTLTGVTKEYITVDYKRKKKGCIGEELSFTSNGNHNTDAIHAVLQLRSLSSITDEEAVEVAKILDISYSNVDENAHFDLAGFTDWVSEIFIGDTGYSINPLFLLQSIDYLRQTGICLPIYHNGTLYQPSDLVKMGLVKIEMI